MVDSLTLVSHKIAGFKRQHFFVKKVSITSQDKLKRKLLSYKHDANSNLISRVNAEL